MGTWHCLANACPRLAHRGSYHDHCIVMSQPRSCMVRPQKHHSRLGSGVISAHLLNEHPIHLLYESARWLLLAAGACICASHAPRTTLLAARASRPIAGRPVKVINESSDSGMVSWKKSERNMGIWHALAGRRRSKVSCVLWLGVTSLWLGLNVSRGQSFGNWFLTPVPK
jgi:hypothetical protein